MKRHIFTACAVLFCAALLLPSAATAQKKKGKGGDRAPFEWQMPALTGNEDFDKYLLECDTMWNRISSYKESIVWYRIDTTYVRGSDGETYKALSVVDQEGNKKSTSGILMQNIDIALNGTMIVADMALMGTSATLASTALPGLGLKAVSYAKYIKQGYQIVGRGGKEIKAIVKAKQEQAAQLKAIKQGAVDVGDIKSTDKVMLNRLDEDETVPEDIDIAALDASFDMGDDSEAIPIDDDLLEQGLNADAELPEE